MFLKLLASKLNRAIAVQFINSKKRKYNSNKDDNNSHRPSNVEKVAKFGNCNSEVQLKQENLYPKINREKVWRDVLAIQHM